MCKMIRTIAMLFIGLALSYVPAGARQGGITPEKRALIKELLQLTGADKLAESMMNAMMNQMEKDLPATLAGTAIPDEAKLTPEERQEIERTMKETTARISKKFRERLAATINFSELMDEISYPLYDKFFTDDELKDLIAFYKTPTGRKSIQVTPQLTAEAIQRASTIITPKIIQLAKEISEEEAKKPPK